MNVAVMTLTRDRLPYTQHCFESLRENAGVSFDWFVLDQASEDGSDEWLLEQDDLDVTLLTRNIGICPGLNLLLDEAFNAADYDVVVRFDNDCEVVQPDTLAAVAAAAAENDAVVAPHVHGLRNPPAHLKTIEFPSGETLSATAILGGVFMAVPAYAFTDMGFRYAETNPAWTGDEAICPWWRSLGGTVGYLDGWAVNHYLTTDGQTADIPDYFARRVLEGGPV